MPKQRTSLSQRKLQWIKDLCLEGYVKVDGSQFICLACSKGYGFSQKGQLEHHAKTQVHIQGVHRMNLAKNTQPLIREALDNANTFFMKMCEAFVAAGIPFSKLENVTFHNFLEKYTKQQLPSRQTLANYLPKVHAQVLGQIKDELGSGPLWVEVDETTDKAGRFIADVIIGALNKDTPKPGYLVLSKPLPSTNNATIIQAVLDSFQVVWPGMRQEEIENRFRLLLTDGVNYMRKAGTVLKSTYPDLIHVTCLSHALHLVAEKIRSMFPNVDKLIGSLKKVFKKAPVRILSFREMNPDLSLPPEAVITRWGSWLKVAEFYAQHFAQVKAVIDTFDPCDAVSIETAQTLMAKPAVAQELSYISANFTFMCTPISVLQQQGATISSTLGIVDEVRSRLQKVNGAIGVKVLAKFDQVIAKNSDLVKIKAISKIINGEDLELTSSEYLEDMGPATIASFKYAPLTTVEVESSFSMHKALFTDRRRRLTVENLEMEMVCHHFYAK